MWLDLTKQTVSLTHTHRHTPTQTQWQTGNFRFAFFCVIFQNRLHFYFYTNFLLFVVAVVFSVNCSCVAAIARIHEDRQTNAHTDLHTHTPTARHSVLANLQKLFENTLRNLANDYVGRPPLANLEMSAAQNSRLFIVSSSAFCSVFPCARCRKNQQQQQE